MSGAVSLVMSDAAQGGKIARVTLRHDGKFNAMSRSMWQKLRLAFETVQRLPDVRCVLISGHAGQFCAGGDISEYASFRFDETKLRAFHEGEVWGGLQAMLDCDVPIVAQIEGNCMGAGLEIASACDLRIASETAKFGAPIAKLGFPMAPREAALIMQTAGELTTREMLLAATVLSADDLQQRGFLNQVVAPDEVAAAAESLAQRIGMLAPGAARQNKATLRVFSQFAQQTRAQAAIDLIAAAYRYAPDSEHREGVAAFMEKRTPQF